MYFLFFFLLLEVQRKSREIDERDSFCLTTTSLELNQYRSGIMMAKWN